MWASCKGNRISHILEAVDWLLNVGWRRVNTQNYRNLQGLLTWGLIRIASIIQHVPGRTWGAKPCFLETLPSLPKVHTNPNTSNMRDISASCKFKVRQRFGEAGLGFKVISHVKLESRLTLLQCSTTRRSAHTGNIHTISQPLQSLVIFNTKASAGQVTSVAVPAEILLRSPWKLFIFIIKTYFYRIKVSKNKII